MRLVVLLSISTPFGEFFSSQGQVIYGLLTLSPLYSASEEAFLVRLACLIHAANVRSEPGSNPSLEFFLLLTPEPEPKASMKLSDRLSCPRGSENLQGDFGITNDPDDDFTRDPHTLDLIGSQLSKNS